MLIEEIKSLTSKYKEEFIAVRRHLHAHPELSYHEFETSAFVQNKLSEFGIPYFTMAGTGVVGIIEGNNPSSGVVALRADMDALPIGEVNKVDYKSTNEGVMHACGHDVHTTCLLGAAKILQELRADWSGTVKLIFQPGEEKNPGGASLMIKEGVLQHPAPAAIFGLHVHPSLPVGKFSFRKGKAMASADEIYITVSGKGGHAAAPHLTGDTILAASEMIVNLQQIISRQNDPLNPTVLSITSFQGGHTTNVIPSEVKLKGTFRALDETWRFKAHELIKNVCEHTAALCGVHVDAVIDVGYPYLENNEQLTSLAIEKAVAFAGAENVEETEMRMGAEDFSFYSQQIPACFYRLGVSNASKGITSGVHTPTFNVDEDAIALGMGMMAYLGSSCRLP